jgi:hypothetical protein
MSLPSGAVSKLIHPGSLLFTGGRLRREPARGVLNSAIVTLNLPTAGSRAALSTKDFDQGLVGAKDM